MSNRNVVPIVFTFDNNFFIPAMVTFHSMIIHSDRNTFYDIFIMINLDEFKKENREDLLNFERHFSHKCKISFIEMKDFGQNFSILDSRFNLSVYYRLFIHNYINYSKVIFSDVDIVILKDLYEVYSTDISDCYLGAIKQSKINSLSDGRYRRYINKANGIKKGNYFNAGFLLMNLDKIRQGNYTSEFISLAQKGFTNNDQDILNLVFENKVRYLPIKYCYIPLESYYKRIEKRTLLRYHSQEEMNEYEQDPAIIHYAGTKPWNVNTLDIDELELDKYSIWWDSLNACLDFVNRKALFTLYNNLNNNVLKLGTGYLESQTIYRATKRLFGLILKKSGVNRIIRF